MRLFEWQSAFLDATQDETNRLVEYLAGVWSNRQRYVTQEENLSEEEIHERDIQKQRFFDFTIDGKISARNYVGLVQFEGRRIEVYPKIFANDISLDFQRWQLNLLYWLTYCRKIKFPFTKGNVSHFQFDDFLELLIYIFANYVQEVISSQPFQSYQSVEEETAFLKGRLSFDRYVTQNLATGKWQNFHCTYEPFVYDNLFNRIVKLVTQKLNSISKNSLNKEKLNEILFLLDDVSDTLCTASDCEKVRLNPLHDDHGSVLQLCKLFLSKEVIDLEGKDESNFCFLVPMEYVFEDFIYGFVSQKWPLLDIRSQSSTYLATRSGNNVFLIKNDLYVPNKLVLDTKYKIREATDLKAGVNQSDMYQMVSYALRRSCNTVMLLYPQTNIASDTDIEFKIASNMLNQPIRIHAKSVDITFSDLQQADELMAARIKKLSSIFT
jgi:5-methylcytosine-specific restriction enzyme subunit McrC